MDFVIIMRKWQKLVAAGCTLLLLVCSVPAFSVEAVSVVPSGNIYPGNLVNVSYTVYVASGVAFPSYYDMQFVTELDDPYWTYAVVVNGVTNSRPVTKGKILTISGFELGYRDEDEVIIRANLWGTIPAGWVSGTNRTLVKIQELDARGYSIPSSVITVNHLIGEPTPPPTPAYGSITVSSSPAGANIYIDNVYKGLTPATLSGIPNGNHIILIKMDGYADFNKSVTILGDDHILDATLLDNTATPSVTMSPGQTSQPGGGSPSPTLPAQAPGYGSLSVTTSPAGALVYVDGAMKGVSPATIPMLTEGPHEVVLILDGYQDLKTTITINTGTTSEYVTGLAKTTKTPGFGPILAAASVMMLVLFRKKGNSF
jgi:hypothetical protein